MTAQIVGFINQLGYARCVDCVAKEDREWTFPVWSDSAPHNDETCDRCGKPFRAPVAR